VVRGHDHTETSISPGVLAEQTDEWAEQRRYMGVEVLAEARQAATLSRYCWVSSSAGCWRRTSAVR
jgi:hypothetical protein